MPHTAAIAALLDDDDWGIRERAARALAGVGAHAAPHTMAIVALLEDDDSGVRRAAVRALVGLGEHATSHTAAIAALLDDDDWGVREAAVTALGAGLAAHAAPHTAAIARLRLLDLRLRLLDEGALEEGHVRTKQAAANSKRWHRLELGKSPYRGWGRTVATPLLVAAQCGHEAGGDLLIAAGADANRATPAGQTLPFVTRLCGHFAVVAQLS